MALALLFNLICDMGMAAMPSGTTVPGRQEALSTAPGLRGLETQQLELGDPLMTDCLVTVPSAPKVKLVSLMVPGAG